MTSSWAARLATLLGRRDRIATPAAPVWRRLFHAAAGSIIPIAAIFAPGHLLLPTVAVLTAGAVILEVVRFRFDKLNHLFLTCMAPLLKGDEDRRTTGTTYMLIASLAALLLFDRPVVVAALLFLSLGDPAAALVGQRMPGPRLWGKSPVGTLAFFGVGLLVVAVWVWSGDLTYHWGLMAGAATAALVELLPLPADDNLTVPLLSGAVMQLAGVG